MSAGGFDAAALGTKYTVLNALPRSLYEAVVSHPGADLLARAGAIMEWRGALLNGILPDPAPSAWPSAEHSRLFSGLLESTRLLGFTKGEEELADAVLLDMLRLSGQADAWQAQIFADVFRELIETEKLRRQREAEAEKARKGGRRPVEEFNLVQARATARDLARKGADAAIEQAFRNTWSERTAAWIAVQEMFGPLSGLLGLGWDLSRSVLQSTGWLAAEKLRVLLEKLPDLKRVIEALGRMNVPPHPNARTVLEDIVGPLVRQIEIRTPVLSPDIPIEMRGVERSGEIARMLPSEAAMLSHPVLKMVWHARRAERALLTYEAEGLDFRTVLVEREAQGPGKKARPAEEKGPMILCVDTSGSMAGAPETVAKAIALEALRTAHAERRRLFVYLFSGPGDVVEQEISVSRQGISGLLQFLASSFHGGTDVAEPLHRAIERIETEDYRHADVLLISDGEFPANVHLEERVEAARERNQLRVHGLLVGSEASPAMRRLCEPLHRFADWRALLGETPR